MGHFKSLRMTATASISLLFASLQFGSSGCFVAASQSLVSQPIWPVRAVTVANTTTLLKDFQVSPPVRFEQSDGKGFIAATCEQTLVAYSFANSYGNPFIGSYSPPECDFNRVTWNLTVESAGKQFDRLGTVALGDIEIFRTSTAEPTLTGIIWTYVKDVSPFLTLFKQPQTLVFDLGNLIDSTYTAAFNVTLTASYYTVADDNDPADIILAVSKGLTNASSVFTLPSDNATSSLIIPQNTIRAIFTIAATGQSNEEFWWSNVLQQDINDFPDYGQIPGYSPFREVQLFIDGTLAGVVWPFPIIFTGGVVPGFWRPIVGIDAFDLKEDEIDVTPWLPLLCDGRSHSFTIVVSGLNTTANGTSVLAETTDSYWLATGKLFLWTDSNAGPTTGTISSYSYPSPNISATSSFQNNSQSGPVLNYEVDVTRRLRVVSTIKTSRGQEQVSWQQSLAYTGSGLYSDDGNYQLNVLRIAGRDSSSSGYARDIVYPLNVSSLYSTQGDNYTIQANLTRGKDVTTFGPSVFPKGLESFDVSLSDGAALSTTQVGQATYIANTTAVASFSFGQTTQELEFSAIGSGGYGQNDTGSSLQLYYRDVSAVNGTVVADEIKDEGASQTSVPNSTGAGGHQAGLFDFAAIKKLGRAGPAIPPMK